VLAPRIVHAIYYKGVSVRGFMNGLLTEFWPAARARVFGLYESGHLAITFDEIGFHRLEGVYDAVERLLSGQSIGKVVVEIKPPDLGETTE
jgi:NADPH-dependent curcumin reductase CurA